MVQFQRHTGMRPGELVIMRSMDLDTSGQVWLYRPGSDQGPQGKHKMAWRGHGKTIALGPKAQEILKPWLRLNLAEYLFQPCGEGQLSLFSAAPAGTSPSTALSERTSTSETVRTVAHAAPLARLHPRSASRFTGRSPGPVYRPRGRISRLCSSCSITWALHPETRDMTKIGVYSGTSRPRA
jgi:hypothetical protein